MAKLIDPIYKKYASKVIGTLANTEFYNYFMDVMRAGQNSVQFSNRRIEKSVDERWVIAVEAVIRPLQEIINNPRNFIMQEEIVVNVALSKSITPDTIRHLSQHGSMIDMVTEDNVRPNRLKQNFKEDSWNTYENRFVYTLLEMAWEFVDKRYKAIFDALNEEYGAYLKMSSDAKSYQERIQTNIDIRIQQEEDLLSVDEKNQSIFARIARLHRLLSSFKDSSFAREMPRYGKIRPPLVRTNAIAKNPNLKACHKLWDFLLAYQDVGYSIEIYEQSAEISDEFMEDIMHSIMFDYIILKNYLEQTRDRAIDTSKPFRKKKMKPQYIKEIIEELVKNYDLPDVEIRKVLIEEITKAQLLKEEEAERRRLVEEKEKEMRERARQEKLEKERQARAAERERLRLEKEREKEAARLEKERQAELARQEKERQRIEQEENLRLDRFRAELNLMMKDREDILQKRAKAAEAERRRMEAESERQRLAEEKRLQEEARKAEQERIRLEKIAELEAQRKAREEEKRRVKEELERQKEEEKKRAAAEKEKLRIEREAAAQKEKERLAKEKAKEKERLAKEAAAQKEKERLAKEKAKEKERLAKEKAKEKERLTKEKVKEKERLAKDKGRVAKEKTGKTREKKVETPVMEESGMPQQTLEMNVVNMAADSYDLTAEKAEEVVVEAAMEAAMEAAIEAVQDVAEEVAEEIALEVAAEAAVEAAIEAVQEVVEAAEVEVAEEAMVDAVVEAAIEAVQEAAAEAVEETTEEATVEAVIEAVQKAVEATAEEAAVETEAVDAAEDNKPADKAADSKAGVHTEGKKERKSQDWRGMLRGLLGRKNKE